jgi:ADP-ribose pyrophosphatase
VSATPPPEPDDVVDLEVVEDRTKGSRADEGFLRVRRLVLRNVRRDGSRSAPYPCDVVSRARTDAVAIVLYDVAEGPPRPGRVRVALKVAVRAPIFLRRRIALTQPDARRYDVIAEIVAGMLEPSDTGTDGIARRAVHEAAEEAGISLRLTDVVPLGGESFPSPGITDEKVHFAAARTPLDGRRAPAGDGSVMEEGTRVVVLPVEEAITACRRGEIPDMKTELALLRLCDSIGYLPGLSRFVHELPGGLGAAVDPLGAGRVP